MAGFSYEKGQSRKMNAKDKQAIVAVNSHLEDTIELVDKHKDSLINNGISEDKLEEFEAMMNGLATILNLVNNEKSYGVDRDD